MQPYSDDLMIFDEISRHYILTEDALKINGIQLRERLMRRRGIDASAIINRVLRRASDMIYNYLHRFNNDNNRQDEMIANYPSCRRIIYQAMLDQVEYILINGDLSRSAEEDKRRLAIDENAKEILNTYVPELGVALTYAGGY